MLGTENDVNQHSVICLRHCRYFRRQISLLVVHAPIAASRLSAPAHPIPGTCVPGYRVTPLRGSTCDRTARLAHRDRDNALQQVVTNGWLEVDPEVRAARMAHRRSVSRTDLVNGQWGP